MKKNVCIDINKKNLVQNLKFSFSNRTTVLGELMQNARRAGASYVNFEYDEAASLLVVSDDGCGIADVNSLLTVAESGWDADMKANEHPFGMGFLSALYSCEHFQVISKFGKLSGNTGTALALDGLELDMSADWCGITSIIMTGYNSTSKDIESKLKALSEGFPIEVRLNGGQFARKASLDWCLPEIGQGLEIYKTDVGTVLVRCDKETGLPLAGTNFKVYLQGLPIYQSSQCYLEPCCNHLVHLDSAIFYARMPDRDKLIDESINVTLIKDTLCQVVRARCMKLKETLTSKQFVGAYKTLMQWGCLDLLNDVNLVPVEVLHEIRGYPVSETDLFGDFAFEIETPVARHEIESGEVKVLNITDDILYDGAARYMFAWKSNSLLYHRYHLKGLDDGHWLLPLVRQLSEEEVQVDLVNEKHRAMFMGSWVWAAVIFCDSYQITIGNDSVEIGDYAFFEGADFGESIVMPVGGLTDEVINQCSSYRDEFEDYQRAAHDDDCKAFRSFVVANTAKEPAEAFQNLMPNMSSCPMLFNKRFIVSLNDEGKVESVLPA